uniref:Uncharacterized protein n=1 Tax=Oryza sativa subsp. japonica TaxID=39947 RepID=Q6AU89_ORYSJ|nr:hypothetical protein [Oryza sativa Japonica Group]
MAREPHWSDLAVGDELVGVGHRWGGQAWWPPPVLGEASAIVSTTAVDEVVVAGDGGSEVVVAVEVMSPPLPHSDAEMYEYDEEAEKDYEEDLRAPG